MNRRASKVGKYLPYYGLSTICLLPSLPVPFLSSCLLLFVPPSLPPSLDRSLAPSLAAQSSLTSLLPSFVHINSSLLRPISPSLASGLLLSDLPPYSFTSLPSYFIERSLSSSSHSPSSPPQLPRSRTRSHARSVAHSHRTLSLPLPVPPSLPSLLSSFLVSIPSHQHTSPPVDSHRPLAQHPSTRNHGCTHELECDQSCKLNQHNIRVVRISV